jgi:uncharacterized protein
MPGIRFAPHLWWPALLATATSAVWAREAPPSRDYGIVKTEASPFAKLRSVDLRSVRWTDGFWADRFKQCHEVTLPHQWRLLSDPNHGHALTNLRIAAGLEAGGFAGTLWQDEWVYKWLEAAASIYAATGDSALDRQMDEVIAVIARAQQPDGHVASQVTARGLPPLRTVHHHELYTMGHLLTAACLHHRLTGKDNFLAVARRTGDFIHRTFTGPDALFHSAMNPSHIMGLIDLYRTTNDRRYLEVANVFIDKRGARPRKPGPQPDGGGTDISQDRIPLRKETEVVGHAVFFTYLYAGAADAYLETGDRTLLDALERLWRDLTERKMYVHGGVAAVHRGLSLRWSGGGSVNSDPGQIVGGLARTADPIHEAAGPAFDLPNATAYNETCGQIGNLMWNWRMLAINGEARHADIMELSLYNSILSGIGLDGASWFYTNPLRWHGRDHKLLSLDAPQRFQPGLKHICCPSNLLRTVAQLHGYVYSVSDEGLWVHFYGGNSFTGALRDGSPVTLEQVTDYPWDGRIHLKIHSAPEHPFALMLRIPGWAEGAQIQLNGRPLQVPVQAGSYAVVTRAWMKGDELTLTLPMEPRLIEANPRIEQTRNQVAVMRGPLVYCLESVDLPAGVKVEEILIPRAIKLTARPLKAQLPGGMMLEGEALRLPPQDWSRQLYRPLSPSATEPVEVRLIPYFAWANRGHSEMAVWLPVSR